MNSNNLIICRAVISSGNRRGQYCGRMFDTNFRLYCGLHSRRTCRVCQFRYNVVPGHDLNNLCRICSIDERRQNRNRNEPLTVEGFYVQHIIPPLNNIEVNPIIRLKPITNLNHIKQMVNWVDNLSTNTKETCSICLDDEDDVEEVSKEKALTKCNHTFHKDCIWEWAFSNRKETCPCCRSNLL